ncbi:hypothetical protein E2C01_039577 [Portunus trituberculatus]|uniref:Uncharacterized protein n=1 Tax=Portunus trituberculatus TaxID=210409 RepID=A0A5B7FF40_PORTR|nr:hypothetical protein [Portunus trituberculatus]
MVLVSAGKRRVMKLKERAKAAERSGGSVGVGGTSESLHGAALGGWPLKETTRKSGMWRGDCGCDAPANTGAEGRLLRLPGF